jgi:hypothetical protein
MKSWRVMNWFAAVAWIVGSSAHAGPPTSGATGTRPTTAGAGFAGFTASRHFGEQIKEYRFEPGVKIHINAPGVDAFDQRKPTTVIIFALPNGNTTAQTIGRRMAPGVDWHFDIQHIGAQTRRLREVLKDRNIVVAYVEADGKSWPAWKAKYTDYGKRIGNIVDSIRGCFVGPNVTVNLSCHSGGGAFVLGYIDGVERIPDWISRIAFLDANYGYRDDLRHGDKLIEWLRQSPDHFLDVICYDDRNVVLNGKPIVGPTGGTYRKTLRMIDRLKKNVELSETPGDGYARHRGLAGRVDVILLDNPKNVILHTTMVGEMGGFIHVMTSGTKDEGKAGTFKGQATYRKWIQPD